MTISETILGGLLITFVSVVIGKVIGTNDNVKRPICDQIRSACQALLIEKIDNLTKKVEDLTEIVNNKILGL